MNKQISCHFCQGPHLVRYCPVEKNKSHSIREMVGHYMEQFYAANFSCIKCGENKNNLKVLNNRTPSLDIVCNKCGHCIEVKSKCLSVQNMPTFLFLTHGSWEYYKIQQKRGLDFVIILYGIRRETKEILIREILYFPNNIINKNNNIINIIRKNKSNYTKIIIPDRLHPGIMKLKLPINSVINFKKKIDSI